MSSSQIAHRLREVAAHELRVPAEQVHERVESLDSIERMQLAVAVEDHFRIRLTSKDEQRLFTLEDVVHLIEEKLAAAGEAR